MKQSKQISSFLKQVSLVVALFAAFVFSASNGLKPFHQESARQVQLQQDAHDQNDERPQAYVDFGCNALAPVAQLVFLQQIMIKAPLPPATHIEEKPASLPPLRVDKYFRTLFRLIISPNAP